MAGTQGLHESLADFLLGWRWGGGEEKKTRIFKDLMHNLCAGLFLQPVVIARRMGRHHQKSNESRALINLKISP